MRSAVEVSDEAVEKMLEDALEHAFEDVNHRKFTEAKLKAEEMLPAVQKALDLAGESLELVEHEQIAQCVLDVKAALEGQAPEPLKRAVAALDEATQRLAAMLMERALSK
jgi:molecular chaperone DnaK